METDIGNPIDYDPTIDSLKNDKIDDNTNEPVQQQQEQYYYQPQELMYPSQQYQQQPEKFDLFASVDKSTWIIAFAVFLLGFFMGKTMQPVILRYT
jgi:hypothetical protein